VKSGRWLGRRADAQSVSRLLTNKKKEKEKEK
jgi:hypothetical protein